jgi:tetratricopeptide (TPR) repeat protein
MDGRCPGCNRAYDISEEFLSMGGKAKCPHCLLELEFEGSAESSSGVDRFRDVTNVDARDQRLSLEEADEIDSHCPSCERRFKVDRKYLDRGGVAQCPNCSVDLVFATVDIPIEEPQDFGAQTEGADVWGESGEINVSDLDELRIPTSVEEPPPAEEGEEEEEEEFQDETVAFDDEVDDVAVGEALEEDKTDEIPTQMLGRLPPVAGDDEVEDAAAGEALEEPAREELEDEDRADEMPTRMLRGSLSVASEEGREDEPASQEQPAEPAAYGAEAEELSEGLIEDMLDEPAAEEPAVEEPAVDDLAEPFAEEAGGTLVLDEQSPAPDGPFGALASNEDWASAAARWAESGFNANEMPSFINSESEDEVGLAGEAEGLHAPSVSSDGTKTDLEEPAPPEEELPLSEEAVEVSDADIMMSETSEFDTLPEPVPTEAGSTWAETASREVAAQRAEKPPMAQAERVAEETSFSSKFKSLRMIATVLGGVVLLAVVLLWVFLGAGDDVAAYRFPKKGLKAGIVKAPAPSVYKAKGDAIEHYGLGNRLAYQGKFEDAILEYKQALRLDPGYPHPHRALGAVYAALGKPKLSASSYETYLRLSPHSADARQVRQIVKATGGK